MPRTIIMPALSAGMEEGTIARWLKGEGDAVVAGEVIAEIETDKATMDYEAEQDGVIAKILAAEGATVPVNGAIALLLREGETDAEPAAIAAKPDAVVTAVPPPTPQVTFAAQTVGASAPARPASSPLARRIAQDRGIVLDGLTGSGPYGRIVRVDVEGAAAQAGQAVAAPVPPQPEPAALSGARHVDVPHSAMRRAIARRLTEAKATIPHFYLNAECEIDALLDLRATLNEQGQGAYKLSVNDFVVKAAAIALRKVPDANAAWTDEAVRRFADVDIAVAVSTEGGLMTPIVAHADRKGLATLSAEIRDLAELARSGKLQPAQYQGGGFTISNLGMFGVRSFSAIINPPQSCILAVGAGERRPVVRGDQCVPATLMCCTLSVDHRSVDGAVGARFLAAFKTLIEHPLQLML